MLQEVAIFFSLVLDSVERVGTPGFFFNVMSHWQIFLSLLGRTGSKGKSPTTGTANILTKVLPHSI